MINIKTWTISDNAPIWFGISSNNVIANILNLTPYIKVTPVHGRYAVEMVDFMCIRHLNAGSKIVVFSDMEGGGTIGEQLANITKKNRCRITYVFDTPISDKVSAEISLVFTNDE